MAEPHYISQDLEDTEVDWPLFEHWRDVWYAHWLDSQPAPVCSTVSFTPGPAA